MDDIKTFVLLKYKILTSDRNTWHLCDTYPVEVNSKWAWRCAGDVEHLARGYLKAEKCVRIAKLYRDGKATKEELDKVWLAAYYAASTSSAYYAATASAYSAAFAMAAFAVHAASNAFDAAIAAAYKEKWNLYIEWLIEELCEYEKNQSLTENIS